MSTKPVRRRISKKGVKIVRRRDTTSNTSSSNQKVFPVLYAENTRGKTKVWKCIVEADSDGSAWMRTWAGQEGGKMTPTDHHVTSGKNLGKANATTPFTQAIADAQSKWNKKHDAQGYRTEDELDNHNENISDYDTQHALPMVADKYTDYKGYLNFDDGVDVQPKLDGVRATAHITSSGEVIFTSRTNGHYKNLLKHIKDEIKSSGILSGPGDYLDGELYTWAMPMHKLGGVCNKKEDKTMADKKRTLMMEYHIFDCFNLDNLATGFRDRFSRLEDFFEENNDFNYLKLVETIEIEDDTEIQEYHDQFVSDGYEGVIIRNHNGPYVTLKSKFYRTKDVQKYKEFEDAEFEIIGFEEASGNDAGTVIWECKTDDDLTFTCRPRGTREERRQWFKDGRKYIGEMLTVRYQGFTEGVPRFPVGIAIRGDW